MKLSEIKNGAQIYINVTLGDKSGRFHATAVKPEAGGIMVVVPDFPVGKKVTFKHENVEAYCFQKNRPPVVWRKVTVSYKKGFYILYSKNDGEIFNRRTAPRIKVNSYGELVLEEKRLSVLIKDVSETGFAIVDPKNSLKLGKDDKLGLEFSDLGFSFSMKGKVKRIKTGDATLYGCLISSVEGDLKTYLKNRDRANKG